jgi:DNA-binding response OmpR family regulator
MGHILIVDDEADIRELLKYNLEKEGHTTDVAENGVVALDRIRGRKPDLILLDVMMPVMDGFTLVEKIRKINMHVPIIFITAKGFQEDKIQGFRAGADDYLVKPFSMEELALRIQVFLKRNMKTSNESELKEIQAIGVYRFDPINFELILNEKKIRLTKKEGALLLMLINRPGELIKREVLLEKIWGSDDYFAGRSMDVYISRLRKYLKEDPNIELVNHHGMGFLLQIK